MSTIPVPTGIPVALRSADAGAFWRDKLAPADDDLTAEEWNTAFAVLWETDGEMTTEQFRISVRDQARRMHATEADVMTAAAKLLRNVPQELVLAVEFADDDRDAARQAADWARTHQSVLRGYRRQVIRNCRNDSIRTERDHRVTRRQHPDWVSWERATGPEDFTGPALHPDNIPGGESAERVALRHLEHLDNLRCLARLPRPLYQAAVLRYLGYTQAEIAAELGVTENAVKMRLRKIRHPAKRAILGLPG